jgi:hypothetical protein
MSGYPMRLPPRFPDGPTETIMLSENAEPVTVLEHYHPNANFTYQRGNGRWWTTYVHCGPDAPYPGATRPITPLCPDCPDFRADSLAHLRDHILVNHFPQAFHDAVCTGPAGPAGFTCSDPSHHTQPGDCRPGLHDAPFPAATRPATCNRAYPHQCADDVEYCETCNGYRPLLHRCNPKEGL